MGSWKKTTSGLAPKEVSKTPFSSQGLKIFPEIFSPPLYQLRASLMISVPSLVVS